MERSGPAFTMGGWFVHAVVTAHAPALPPDSFPAWSMAETVYKYTVVGAIPVSVVQVAGAPICLTKLPFR